MIKLQNRLLLS